MKIQKELIDAFYTWLKSDQHKEKEDIYTNQINLEYLSGLSKEDFLKFFFEFTHAGGMIQSGGERFAERLVEIISANYDEFKTRILDSFNPDFNLNPWLAWAQGIKFFSPSTATIFLNRVNKHKYVVVNGKSIGGLEKLGFKIPYGILIKSYKAVETAETSLLRDNPELENYYRIDALMHFIVAEEEGKAFFNSPNKHDYFNLTGFNLYKSYFGKQYDTNSDATKWFKDTRSKLEFLVDLLRNKLSDDIMVNYSEMPNARAGIGKPPILKRYVLTGFSPDGHYPEHGELFIKLKFHKLDISPLFDIEIDQNNNAPERPFNDDIKQITEATRLRIPVDGKFPQTWDSLIEAIQDHVKHVISEYRRIVSQKTTLNIPDKITEGAEPKVLPSDDHLVKPLNTILYGPPGTGKTYHSINYAVSIVENKLIEILCQEERTDVKKRFENYVKEGQIAFCTFHQSLGYEDFIEGIKPVEPESEEEQLSYAVDDGIFKQMCVNASFSFVQDNITQETENALDFSSAYDEYIESVSEQLLKGEEVKIQTTSGGLVLIDSITQKNNIKIKHVNGTRDYTVSKTRLGKLAKAFPDLNQLTNINDQFRSEIGGSNSSAYWAVLNAIRQRSAQYINKTQARIKPDKEYLYNDKKRIIETLKNDDFKKENPKQYVLIIDEINRGNVSQVFGEIITLMEEDKRLGADEALKAILPYSKENFGVPCNLHIIGTMNTADRSVEALDTALRRRFAFINLEPEPDKLETTDDGINLAEILSTINNRLSILKDYDHTIGHAWLWNINNVDQLREVFRIKILPLLKEYFYNDYEKLGLVLGDVFFEPHVQVNGNVFADFSGGNGLAMQYDQSWQFRLKPVEKLTISDFKTLTPQSNHILPDEEQ